MFSISLSLNAQPSDPPFTFREVTINPFVMSHNLVDMWCEVVLNNEGADYCQPPEINLQFTHQVLVQSRSQRDATNYLTRMLKADAPSQLIDYLPTWDLNEAMYSEMWFSFLDLALPRRTSKPDKPADIFSVLYTKPLRLVQNVDTFLHQINHLSLARLDLSSAWSILERTDDIYTICLTQDESLSFRVQVDPLADGTCVFKRMPWKVTDDAGEAPTRYFPATPRVAVLDNEATWRITPWVRRQRGNLIGPDEGIMFWFWWRHLQPFDEGIIHSASPFSDDFILSYQVKVPQGKTDLRYNTFLRCSPQLSVAGEAAQSGKRFVPVPVTSEIFSEWAWYTERIDRWLYRFAKEGASQYEMTTTGGMEIEALAVTTVFSDTHAEQARLSRLLILTAVFLGILTNFFVAAVWGWRETAPGGQAGSWDWHVLGVIVSSVVLGVVVMVKSWLEYQRFTSNPILVHDLIRYVQMWLRRRGFLIAEDDERLFRMLRRFGAVWNCVVVLSAVTFAGMVWGHISQEGVNDTLLIVALLFVLITLPFRAQLTHRRKTL